MCVASAEYLRRRYKKNTQEQGEDDDFIFSPTCGNSASVMKGKSKNTINNEESWRTVHTLMNDDSEHFVINHTGNATGGGPDDCLESWHTANSFTSEMT
eukprot:9307447-Ditylum_brightwellii.AAC.1